MKQNLNRQLLLGTTVPIKIVNIDGNDIELITGGSRGEPGCNLIELEDGNHLYIQVDEKNNITIRSSIDFSYDLSFSIKTKES